MNKYFSVLIYIFFLLVCAEITVSAQELETKPFDVKNCIPLRKAVNITIKTRDELLNAVRVDARKEPCLKNLEKIDFEKNSLLGVKIREERCRNYFLTDYRTLEYKEKKNYTFFLLFSIYNDKERACTPDITYSVWYLIPKIPVDYEIIFEVNAHYSDKM